MKNILQYQDLINVHVRECTQPMVIVQDEAPEITCKYEKSDMLAYLGETFVLRSEVVKRLKQASNALRADRPNLSIRLVYGYRHPDVQKIYFENQKRQIADMYPDLSTK
jgi:hypothetical protein